jgi:hypothetical protein
MSGCRFISGDPRDAAFMGERVFCGAPVARQGEAWCDVHRARVYLPATVSMAHKIPTELLRVAGFARVHAPTRW